MRKRYLIREVISAFLIVSLIISTAFTEKLLMISTASSSVKGIRLKINRKNVTKKTFSMKQGKKQKLKVIVPKQKKIKIVFRSNKRNIVSVSKAGTLTAKRVGSARITVTARVKKKKYKGWVKIKVISSERKKSEGVKLDTRPGQTPSPLPENAPAPTPLPTPTPSLIPSETKEPDAGEVSNMYDITLHVNGQSFSAKLYKSATTELFIQKLPLSITMNELNGNEKYYYFSESFPTASERVSQIQAGDIKLYGSSCLVLFYESFSTSYSYTSLGYVGNPEGLAGALGTGNVSVVIAKKE